MSDNFPIENSIFGLCAAADVVNYEIAFCAFVVNIWNQPDVRHSLTIQVPSNDIARFVIFRFVVYRQRFPLFSDYHQPVWFKDDKDNNSLCWQVADRVIFQVFEADFDGAAFVQSLAKRGGDTVLFVDDAGIVIIENEAELPKVETE